MVMMSLEYYQPWEEFVFCMPSYIIYEPSSSLTITLKYLNTAMMVFQGSVFHEQAQPNPFNKRYHNRTSAWGLLHVSKLTIPIIA